VFNKSNHLEKRQFAMAIEMCRDATVQARKRRQKQCFGRLINILKAVLSESVSSDTIDLIGRG
jgi:hypothetical protein